MWLTGLLEIKCLVAVVASDDVILTVGAMAALGLVVGMSFFFSVPELAGTLCFGSLSVLGFVSFVSLGTFDLGSSYNYKGNYMDIRNGELHREQTDGKTLKNITIEL
jgi:hypothetical protein